MISVIIVNYNKKDLLRRCLDSIRRQSFQGIEVIVVDNASGDDSVEVLGAYYPEARLMRNTRNLLFCRAYNQGIEISKGNFILCMNNDAELEKDYLKEALSAIGKDEKIGMVSGKILRMDKRTIDSTGLFLGRSRKAIERGYGRLDRGQYDEPGYIFGVSGSCAFFRRRMLEDIRDENGYFDERFGMYYEDLDLCWRAQKKGWKAYYNPKAVAYHVRGGTAITDRKRQQSQRCRCRAGLNLPYISDELKRRYIKNRHMCMKKNDTLAGYIANLPFIIAYDIKIRSFILLCLIFKRINLTIGIKNSIISPWR